MNWNLKGRAATQSVYPDQFQWIVRSQMWLQVSGKPLLWVVERAVDLSCVGAFSGPQHTVELFSCLVVRMLQICPSPAVVFAMVSQDVHKYLRVVGMVVCRLIGNAALSNACVALCFEDFRLIRVRNEDGSLAVLPLDVLCEMLFFPGEAIGESGSKHQPTWFGLRLARNAVVV